MKNILFVSPIQPFIPHTGYTFRTAAVLKHLSAYSQVDVVFTTSASEGDPLASSGACRVLCAAKRPSRTVATIKSILTGVPYHTWLFSPREIVRAIHAGGKNYDLIYLNKTTQFPLVRALASSTPVVIDQIAEEQSTWDNLVSRHPRFPVRMAARLNRWMAARFDPCVYKNAKLVICITPEDRDRTLRRFPFLNTIVMPQCIDTKAFKAPEPTGSDGDDLLFCGTDASRNVDAIRFFIGEIQPLLEARSRVLWIGNVSASIQQALASPRLAFTGRVAELHTHFQRGFVYISPFRMAEGMKTKLIEALAFGKAVVATPESSTGILDRSTDFFRIASTPAEFAREVDNLVRLKPAERFRIANEANSFAATNFDWDSFFPHLDRALTSVSKSESSLNTLR